MATARVVHMFVLGIAPGLPRCGYGVVAREGRTLRAEAAGVVRTPPPPTCPAAWPTSNARSGA